MARASRRDFGARRGDGARACVRACVVERAIVKIRFVVFMGLKPAHDDAVDARGAEGRDKSIATNGTASLIARASRSLASGARQGVFFVIADV
jgi:hypothetical protein